MRRSARRPNRIRIEAAQPAYADGARTILDYLQPQLKALWDSPLAPVGTDSSPSTATDWLQFSGRRLTSDTLDKPE